MDTEDTRDTLTPYFDANAGLVAKASIVDEADRELLAAVMTIKDLTDLLHDPNMNIVRDIQEDFIVDVLIVDVKYCLNSLRTYEGKIRKGIPEAKDNMYKVYNNLYTAQLAAQDQKREEMKNAIIPCAQLLDYVYGQLQHWKELADQVHKLDTAHPQPPVQTGASDLPPGEKAASDPAAQDASPPA